MAETGLAPRSRLRFPIMLLATVTLLAALWGGFVRLGWPVSVGLPAMLVSHGPLIVSGFLGTLIGIERAVALGRRITYLGPLLTALGSVTLLAGLPAPIPQALTLLGSAGMLAMIVYIVRKHPAPYTVTMAAGALAWLAGNALWLAGWPVFQLVGWWVAFLVLTIAGERLELSQVLRHGRASLVTFALAAAPLAAGLVASLFAADTSARLIGAGLVALALWLLRYDVARFTIRKAGLTRFIAACLLSGYVWLLLGGGLWLAYGAQTAGLRYDALLHTVFLGFVLAMIFGHAPIIFPAVTGVEIAYRPLFYAHLALLHVSLVVRVAGDLAGWLPGRLWGGLFNVVALLVFAALTAASIRRGASAQG